MVVPRDHKLSETGHRHGHSEPHVSDDIFEYNDASKDDEDLTEEFELAKELLTDEKHSAGREERAVE